MPLPLNAYIGIAIFASALLLVGLVSCLGGLRNSALFFTLPGVRRIDEKMSRRGARVFCLAVGSAIAGLGLILLLVSLRPLFPTRRLRMISEPKKVSRSVEPAGAERSTVLEKGKGSK